MNIYIWEVGTKGGDMLAVIAAKSASQAEKLLIDNPEITDYSEMYQTGNCQMNIPSGVLSLVYKEEEEL